MKQTISLVILSALLALGAPLRAQGLQQDDDFNKGGRTAMQFLKIGMGARQVAVGEASVALVEDANAVFWNPAGLRGVERFEASFTYTRWLADMNMVSGVLAGRWRGIGTFALSIAALDYGDIPEAIVGGGGDGRTGATFSGGDLLVGFHAAREFTDRLSIGGGVKYVHERLHDQRAGTVTFDVGTSYRIGYKGLRLGMSAQNYGGSVQWLDVVDRPEGYDLPLVFRIGLSGHLVGADALVDAGAMHAVTASVEALNSNDYSERLHAGLEYTFADLLALRGGYRFGYAEGQLALGGGIHPRVGGVEMRLDYAYVGYENLTAPHRMTLSLAF